MNEIRARVAIARWEEAQEIGDYQEVAPEEYRQIEEEANEARKILEAIAAQG